MLDVDEIERGKERQGHEGFVGEGENITILLFTTRPYIWEKFEYELDGCVWSVLKLERFRQRPAVQI